MMHLIHAMALESQVYAGIFVRDTVDRQTGGCDVASGYTPVWKASFG